MRNMFKMLVVAAAVATSASSAFAATAPHRYHEGAATIQRYSDPPLPLMERRYAATWAGDAATNQYTNRAGLVDGAP